MQNVTAIRSDIHILRDTEVQKLGEEVGAVVYWNASEHTPHAKIVATATQAGIDPKLLMDLPSPQVALRRASQDMQCKDVVAKQSDGRWIIKRITKNRAQEDLDWCTEAKASLNEAGQLVIEGNNVEPALEAQLRALYQKHLTHLSSEDMSKWLVDMAKHVGGVALAKKGGWYFIPPSGLADWRLIARVVEDASGYEMQDIPAGRGANVAKAVMSGISHEIQTAVEEMERDLMSGDKKGKALRAREHRCDALVAKIEEFEPVVGRTLNEIRSLVGDLQVRLAAAALMQSGD